MDNAHRTAAPGTSSAELVITLLRDAIVALRRHPRDAGATDVAIRAHRLLQAFPTHFVTEYLAQTDSGAELRHVPMADWPEWGQHLARPKRTLEETTSAWGMVLAAAKATAGDAWHSMQGSNLERVLQVLGEQPAPYDRAANDGSRALWLVVREAGAPDGVTITPQAMARTDWSRARMTCERTPEGGYHYRALLDPQRCGTCGQAIEADAMTGTRCACTPAQDVAACCGRAECGGECGVEWRGMVCATCLGAGSIDETLGGESTSNPAAPCPDCTGRTPRKEAPGHE